MRFFRPCFVAGWLYPEALFRVRTTEKVLFLTFDDGPDPHSTPALLDLLDGYSVKAIFFCNGSAAENHAGIVDLIRSGGHIVGNHSYNHLDGWRTPVNKYLENVSLADPSTSPLLFRPPYGHLTIKQYKCLREKYRIVFWDIMPYDFDRNLDPEKVLQILKKKTRSGSVIVLHDSENSMAMDILEDFIRFAMDSGYTFSIVLPLLPPMPSK